MWNKRREEEVPTRPAAAPPKPAEPSREPVAMGSPAPRPAEPEPTRGVATIGKSVVIKGQISSHEDLYLDGEMEGTVEVPEHRLTIGPHGKIQAGIKAREVVILGAAQGDIEASDKIDIRKDARLVGDIKTGRIVIEDGAYFKGSIDIVKAEAKPAPAKPQPAAQSAPAPVGAGAERR